MNLMLIRHTRLAASAVGRCYGRTEMSLAETFEEEAATVRASLPWTPEIVWTSPSQRCRALADNLSDATGASVCVDVRLMELNFGNWEGHPWNELRGAEVDAWIQNPWEARPPNGETATELVDRVRAFRGERLTQEGSQRAAVITHAGVIRVWRSLTENITLAEAFAQPVAHGGIWVVK